MPKGVGSEKALPFTPVTSPPIALAEELEPMQDASEINIEEIIIKNANFLIFIYSLFLLNSKLLSSNS